MAQPFPATFGDAIAFPHLHRHANGVTHVHAHTHVDGHALSFSDRYVHHHSHGDTDMAHRDADLNAITNTLASALVNTTDPDWWAGAVARAIITAIDARNPDLDRVTVDRVALDALEHTVDSYSGRAARDIVNAALRVIDSAD